MPATRATVLFAHGSRDPAWSRPIEAVAQRMRALEPACLVRCAYLELTPPDLPTVVDALVAAGAQDIAIVPMFLGAGGHVRKDLPNLLDALRAAHPGLGVTLHTAVGEIDSVMAAMAGAAVATLSTTSP